MHYQSYCDLCGRQPAAAAMRCPDCAGPLSFRYDTDRVEWDDRWRGVLRYWRLLPVAAPERAVTLGEGATPLLRSRAATGPELYFKVETGNPTGSHKDRQICVAMSHAVRVGATVSALVSSGSTGLSNAAYAARAGLRSVVCMTQGVPEERVYPVFALGSQIVEVTGPVDELIELLARLTAKLGVYHSTTARSCNPYQAEGAKTIAYEIVEDLGRVPQWVVVPAGGGGTLAAVARGFAELREAGLTDRVPRMVGAVSARFDALARAHATGLRTQRELERLPDPGGPATSVQAKLAHIHPPDGADALAAVAATDGLFIAVSDSEALAAQAHLGAAEGIYVEPSSGTGVAASQRLLAEGDVTAADTVVVVLCGSGFRETGLTMAHRPMTRTVVDADGLRDVLAAG
ncbi:MAG TPA: pyridoxal-phosphate dependent enzyme [Natronosporangium sp.]|nr:pyridoxal-phosphate dependent enzyme [Natronosporangium sp.]